MSTTIDKCGTWQVEESTGCTNRIIIEPTDLYEECYGEEITEDTE